MNRSENLDRLARSVVEGDERAFEELLRLLDSTIWQAIKPRTRGRLVEIRDDVYQIVAHRLWERLDRYTANRRLDAWVYRLAANATIDYLRRMNRRRQIEIVPQPVTTSDRERNAGLVHEQAVSTEQTPESYATIREYWRHLGSILRRMRHEHRVAWVLAYRGWSRASIAERYGVSPITVRLWVHRARQQIARSLSRRGIAA